MAHQHFEAAGLLHRCQISRGAPSLSHLLFVDDSFFFFRATEAESLLLKNTLFEYKATSGQAINY